MFRDIATRTYDPDSNVTLRCTRAGLPIAYAYDTLNRLNTKTLPAPATPCTTAPSGTVVTYAYDLAGRRTGVGDTGTSITPVSTASSVQYATTMTYDALNRPTGASWTPAPTAAAPAAANVTFTHTYNAVNQRTGQSVSDNNWISYPAATPATTGYTANALNQYTAVGSASPTYDGNGNLTSDGTTSFGFDPENRLVSASGAGNTASYAFDGRGRRKSKTVNGTTTISVTDAQNREVLDYDGATGAILRWYAYGLGPNALLNQMNVAAGTRATLLPDQLGSVIGSMDSSTGTIISFAYRSYGTSGAAPAQFGYTGQRVDAESGTYYYRARQYAPGWGRFLQADPIGYQGGMHLYGYVGNDPLNAFDPKGLLLESAGTAAAQFGSDLIQQPRADLEIWASEVQRNPWSIIPIVSDNLTPALPEFAASGTLFRGIGAISAAEGEGAFASYMNAARTLDVSTAENGAVLYSGPGNRALAEQFAAANGRTTLEMTPSGSWLDSQRLFGPQSPLTPDQATQVWSTLSQRFAAGASGNAVGFVQGARAGSIFNTIEFPTLVNNPAVTNVLTGGY